MSIAVADKKEREREREQIEIIRKVAKAKQLRGQLLRNQLTFGKDGDIIEKANLPDCI